MFGKFQRALPIPTLTWVFFLCSLAIPKRLTTKSYGVFLDFVEHSGYLMGMNRVINRITQLIDGITRLINRICLLSDRINRFVNENNL